MSNSIEVGDHVRYKTGKVHWVVSNVVGGHRNLWLVSPFSGRTVTEWEENIELVKKGEKNVYGEFSHVRAALCVAGRRVSSGTEIGRTGGQSPIHYSPVLVRPTP